MGSTRFKTPLSLSLSLSLFRGQAVPKSKISTTTWKIVEDRLVDREHKLSLASTTHDEHGHDHKREHGGEGGPKPAEDRREAPAPLPCRRFHVVAQGEEHPAPRRRQEPVGPSEGHLRRLLQGEGGPPPRRVDRFALLAALQQRRNHRGRSCLPHPHARPESPETEKRSAPISSARACTAGSTDRIALPPTSPMSDRAQVPASGSKCACVFFYPKSDSPGKIVSGL